MAGRAARLAALCLIALLAGCAGVLPRVARTPSQTLVAPADTTLGSIAADAGLRPGQTGAWPMVQGAIAIDARLALIEQATTSLDLQYYLVGDDETGHQILRALRDAANRGVRVRLLVDDLYTAGLDRLLIALAQTPNAEVRIFNPIITARDSSLRRLIAMGLDFKRLDHRMHNKLFIADGRVAVAGGRNLADEYFLRGRQSNFIDFDLFLAGAIVPQLNHWFDLYWNSEQVYPALPVERASGMDVDDVEGWREAFERATLPKRVEPPTPALDSFGAPPLRQQVAERRYRLVVADDALSYADSPDKIDPANHSIAIADTLTHRFYQRLDEAHEDVLLISPYFIPGTEAIKRIGELRRQDVHVAVLTNSLAVSDEPLVSVGTERYQIELLKMGVELYELSSTRLKLDSTLRNLLGDSIGRLHAKLGFIDHKSLLVGSMNLDPRSATINTEIGIIVQSPTLVQMVTSGFRIGTLLGVYRVELRPGGRGVRWTAMNPDGSPGEELDTDPDTSWGQRLRLLFLSVFVPESQL
ncbi:MAG: phospholipase D family protein [Proteobacteria bacterium]|nr:phospholipase D family protein [Pseudomonadota bacterium]